MIVHLLRHAKTYSNQTAIYAGRNEEPILKGARAPILYVARSEKLQGVERIFASPLKRTQMTARIVSEVMNLPVTTEQDLIELDFGPWTGKVADEISSEFPEAWVTWRNDPFSARVDGMETLASVQARALTCIRRIAEKAESLVVTHESVIKAVICSVHPDRQHAYRTVNVRNCSLHSFDIDPNGERSLQLLD